MSHRTITLSRRSITTLTMAVLSIMVIVIVSIGLIESPTFSANATTTSARSATPKVTGTQIPKVGLVVRNRQIYATTGQRVTLVGASHSDLEYSCKGDGHFQTTDFQAMRAWGMTVVRIPLWSKFWLNLDGTCPNYQTLVAQTVANAEAANLFVILDLQWIYPFPTPSYVDSNGNQLYQYPMPDTGESLQFWQQLAKQYGPDPRVIFDLYGEPNGVTWQTWYSGGFITTANGGYQAIGMRALLDAVRKIAPNNVVIISGTNWGYDLSLVGTTYTFPEKNVLFGTHPFDHGDKQLTDFNRAFGTTAATKVAVIVTEFGGYDCTTGYITPAIAYFNQHHIPWLAWAWAPYGCSTPSMLSNWNGTPSQPYGAYIQAQMLALHVSAP